MAITLNPYLTFDGSAREALTFYGEVLGGELKVNTFGEFGSEGPEADLIMHGQLETPDGLTLMGADTPPGMTFEQTQGITVSLSGPDERLRAIFEQLSEGGQVTMPLEKQMWGDEFGQLVDRYGIPWMVNLTAS